MESPSKKVTSSDVGPTLIAPLGGYEESPTTILTSYKLGLQGNKEGMESTHPPDIDLCHVELKDLCVELNEIPSVLITPVVMDNSVATFDKLCDQTIETSIVLRAPTAKHDSLHDLCAPRKLKETEIEPRDLIFEPGLDHVQLIKHDDVPARIPGTNSLYSILMDPPMPLSHART